MPGAMVDTSEAYVEVIRTLDIGKDGKEYRLDVPAPLVKEFEAILRGQEYGTMTAGSYDPGVVVDVGANVGAYTLYARLTYPKAAIVAYEPVTSNYRLLQANMAPLEGVTLHQAALAERAGTAFCYYGNICRGACGLYQGYDQLAQGEEVEVRDVAAELAAFPAIGILKIDTEGSERPILERLAEAGRLPDIDFVLLEYHSEDDRLAIDRLLADTHLLYSARGWHPHRGVNRYVSYRLANQDAYIGELTTREREKVATRRLVAPDT